MTNRRVNRVVRSETGAVKSRATARKALRLQFRVRATIEWRVGRLAQLVERLAYTEDVGSSSLSSPTMNPHNSFRDLRGDLSPFPRS